MSHLSVSRVMHLQRFGDFVIGERLPAIKKETVARVLEFGGVEEAVAAMVAVVVTRRQRRGRREGREDMEGEKKGGDFAQRKGEGAKEATGC